MIDPLPLHQRSRALADAGRLDEAIELVLADWLAQARGHRELGGGQAAPHAPVR